MTRERILELREILLSIQTGFSLVNVAVACAILESISGLEPSSVITEPWYLKLVHCLQHQQDLYCVFTNFKKAFNRVWQAALWATMKKYISTNLIRVIKNLYYKATSAVFFSIGDWFRTTFGVRQGCLLSPTLLNIFLERIMTDALEHHEGHQPWRRNNFRFADDIDGLAGKKEEWTIKIKKNSCCQLGSSEAYGHETDVHL